MQKTQEEQARWTRERQILESNKEGLQQEIVDLEESIAAAKARIESTGKEEQDDLDQKREYDAARAALADSLVALEEQGRRVIPLIPEFYLTENTKLAVAVEDLKKTETFTEEQRAKNLGSRLSAVSLVLAEVEKFQMQMWVRGEQRVVDGEEKLVTTIYFGLSTAFAADSQQTVALRGLSGEDGWTFTRIEDAGAAARVLELIDVASLKGEIKFVEVPLELR